MPRPKKSTYNNEKPPLSYVALCAMAIRSSPRGMMSLNEIYRYIINTFPYYKNTASKWRNSLRHNLSFNDCFVKIIQGSETGNKRSLWSLHPNCGDMFEDGSLLRRKRRFITRVKKIGKAQHGLEDIGRQLRDVACFSPSQRHHQTQRDSSGILERHQISSKFNIFDHKEDKKALQRQEKSSNSTNFTIENILRGSVTRRSNQLDAKRNVHHASEELKVSDQCKNLIFPSSEYRGSYEYQRRPVHACEGFCFNYHKDMQEYKNLLEMSFHHFCKSNTISCTRDNWVPLHAKNKESFTLHYKGCW